MIPRENCQTAREAVWKTLSAVQVDGDIIKWFGTLVGVLQGYMMSPLRFNIFLGVVMALATEHAEEGAVISGHVISNLRFADDIAVLEESEDGLQRLVSNIHRESTRFGLKINISKTEVQRIACDNGPVRTVINNTPLKQVDINRKEVADNIKIQDGSWPLYWMYVVANYNLLNSTPNMEENKSNLVILFAIEWKLTIEESKIAAGHHMGFLYSAPCGFGMNRIEPLCSPACCKRLLMEASRGLLRAIPSVVKV